MPGMNRRGFSLPPRLHPLLVPSAAQPAPARPRPSKTEPYELLGPPGVPALDYVRTGSFAGATEGGMGVGLLPPVAPDAAYFSSTISRGALLVAQRPSAWDRCLKGARVEEGAASHHDVLKDGGKYRGGARGSPPRRSPARSTSCLRIRRRLTWRVGPRHRGVERSRAKTSSTIFGTDGRAAFSSILCAPPSGTAHRREDFPKEWG
jgi:hypothetical protein